jgi:phosphate transport system substrate-binding protein
MLKTTTRILGLPMVLAAALAVSACGASNEANANASGGSGSSDASQEQLDGTLNGAGSSAQQAAMQGWAAGFNAAQPGVTVNYDPVGSGGGREQFISGGVDFAGSDSPLSTDEELPGAKDRCGGGEVFELPNYVSAIAVIYNLDGVDDLNLSPETTAKIFNGSITTWNDPAIAADNPDAQLPSSAITPVHRSDKSGTTKNFTDYLDKASNGAWTGGAVDEWPIKSGEAANGTSGVVQAVQGGQGTIGYADESQAGDLGIANIKVGDEFVAPSAEGAAAVVEGSKVQSGRGKYDFALDINRTPDSADQYPLVLVSYHIGCIQYDDANTAAMVQAFMNYVISADGQKAAADQAGSAPISDTLREQSQQAVDAIAAG